MGIADVVIVLAVIALLGLCVRSFVKGGSECSGCASGASCSARATGKGSCSAAQDMLARANAALGSADRATEGK